MPSQKRDWNISWSGIKAWWLVKKSETWPFPRSRGRKGRPYRSRKKVSSQDWQTRARIGPFSMDIDFQKLEWLEGSEKKRHYCEAASYSIPENFWHFANDCLCGNEKAGRTLLESLNCRFLWLSRTLRGGSGLGNFQGNFLFRNKPLSAQQ